MLKQVQHIDPSTLRDTESLQKVLKDLVNVVERQSARIEELVKENQVLKDEINRLKGEQGKPNIRANNQKAASPGVDLSSEKERKQRKVRKKRRVKFDSSRRVDIERTVDIADKSNLPLDVVFKGYAKSHYQNLAIKAQLIQLKRAIYYSPSEGKTYTAAYPNDYEGGDYTQDLKGHIVMLKFKFGMSIPQIGEFLRMNGIEISDGTVSHIYLECGAKLEQEGKLIHQKGLENGLYAQSDTTGARVDGVNHHTHIFANAYFTSYITRTHKDRQTVLDLLRSQAPRVYLLNEMTFELYAYLKIPKKVQACLLSLPSNTVLDRASFELQIKAVLAEEDYERHQAKILEGAYLAAYQNDQPLKILLADDAPQYKLCALMIALCWVHIGRNFKKLNPKFKYHQELLADFLTKFWVFYHQLKAYQKNPEPLKAKQLSTQFDELFALQTGYALLDEQIAKTKAKKSELLVVLTHPYVPLHNNEAELAARKQVRYRDHSFQTRTNKGTKAKDTFFTIIQTCQKLGLNAYEYILDRLKNNPTMIPVHEVLCLKFIQF